MINVFDRTERIYNPWFGQSGLVFLSRKAWAPALCLSLRHHMDIIISVSMRRRSSSVRPIQHDGYNVVLVGVNNGLVYLHHSFLLSPVIPALSWR